MENTQNTTENCNKRIKKFRQDVYSTVEQLVENKTYVLMIQYNKYAAEQKYQKIYSRTVIPKDLF